MTNPISFSVAYKNLARSGLTSFFRGVCVEGANEAWKLTNGVRSGSQIAFPSTYACWWVVNLPCGNCAMAVVVGANPALTDPMEWGLGVLRDCKRRPGAYPCGWEVKCRAKSPYEAPAGGLVGLGGDGGQLVEMGALLEESVRRVSVLATCGDGEKAVPQFEGLVGERCR
ncbi:uncharacterized protein BDZ99DRAFT_462502 [Mytilinidion resinicola]|uniref:Uncharacterized protein n=1 Tax=Mytilinidion resinicola TaxID=574789 RepID=A0A6A6YSB5_9PEZI|nr:uncharacterized protein BDZ99DRAFT_462502 [Mytilinidion resinicola]KAF2811263.1 hypothetical protein BDZ99DRAFT_462502 [Mytilinidion resinicola]